MSYELVIEAGRTERQYWKDLWRYRELFLILTWRDVAVQYKQTVVGILWAVLRPLLTMAAFTFVFGKVAKLPSEGVAPYPLMVFVAMLPWQFFSTAIAWLVPSNSGYATVKLRREDLWGLCSMLAPARDSASRNTK